VTVDFSHGYQAPGVYIEETTTPLVSSTGIPITLVALVGPSAGYQVNTEQIALSDAGVALARQGIDGATIDVSVVGTGADVDGADFNVSSAGTAPANTTTITRNNSGATPADTQVFVTYRYTDPAFFTPKTFENYEDVKDAFGEPINLSVQAPGDTTYKAVLSPLSLAAKVAFENGAGRLVLVATTPPGSGATTDAAKSTANVAALAAAYDKIESALGINLVVPLTDGIIAADVASVGTAFKAHLDAASTDGFRRFGVLGFDPGVVTAPDTALASWKYRRLMEAFAAPSGLTFYNGASNQQVSVGHQYLAAAYAGIMARNNVQKSITHELIQSFSGIAGTPLSNALKNQYAQAGVAITEVNRLGLLWVRHGVTTDVSNVNTREGAVVRAKDTLVTMLQTSAESSGLIGSPIDDHTLLGVKAVIAGALDTAKGAGIINDYNNLGVRQTSGDPSVIEVRFGYKPTYPLNYIVISFSINIETGATDLADAA
jgi:hypothetical protein